MSHNMNMFNTPQKIELYYGDHQLWFEVWRFSTPTELYTALTKAGVRDFDSKTVAYTQIILEGSKCGRMYLLDSSIKCLAMQAAKMAFGVVQRRPASQPEKYMQEDHAAMVGFITSALYSKQKY